MRHRTGSSAAARCKGFAPSRSIGVSAKVSSAPGPAFEVSAFRCRRSADKTGRSSVNSALCRACRVSRMTCGHVSRPAGRNCRPENADRPAPRRSIRIGTKTHLARLRANTGKDFPGTIAMSGSVGSWHHLPPHHRAGRRVWSRWMSHGRHCCAIGPSDNDDAAAEQQRLGCEPKTSNRSGGSKGVSRAAKTAAEGPPLAQ